MQDKVENCVFIVMPSVAMLNVFVLSVVAPSQHLTLKNLKVAYYLQA